MIKRKDELLKKLVGCINAVTAVEDEIYSFVNELEEVNNKLLDIEHYIEDKEITLSGSIKFTQLLKELRLGRRQMKQMWDIYNTYGVNRAKLQQKENREFLFSELYKTDKGLQTKYNYRAYTVDYLDKLNEDKPLPRKRKKKDISYNNTKEE